MAGAEEKKQGEGLWRRERNRYFPSLFPQGSFKYKRFGTISRVKSAVQSDRRGEFVR